MGDKKLPFGLTPTTLFEWTYRAAALLLLALVLYLQTIFVTKPQFDGQTAKVNDIDHAQTTVTSRIDVIERNQNQAAAIMAATSQALAGVNQELAALRATQQTIDRNAEKNFDRIFRKLDSLATRPQ